jgi:hypothetical protein
MSFTLTEYENAWDTEEKLNEFFKKSQPSDFYFRVDDYDGTFIVIVAKAFFDTNGYVDDQTPRIDHLLPNDFYEAMESTWECERSVEDVKKDLIARGFEEKLKLNHGDE